MKKYELRQYEYKRNRKKLIYIYIYIYIYIILGESSDAVQVAVRDMRHEQELGLYMGFVCISCIFIGTAIQTWANYPPCLNIILS